MNQAANRILTIIFLVFIVIIIAELAYMQGLSHDNKSASNNGKGNTAEITGTNVKPIPPDIAAIISKYQNGQQDSTPAFAKDSISDLLLLRKVFVNTALMTVEEKGELVSIEKSPNSNDYLIIIKQIGGNSTNIMRFSADDMAKAQIVETQDAKTAPINITDLKKGNIVIIHREFDLLKNDNNNVLIKITKTSDS